MHAELMVEKEEFEDEAVDDDEYFERSNSSDSVSSEGNIYEYYGSQWVKKHGLDATRELQCTYSHNKRKFYLLLDIIPTKLINQKELVENYQKFASSFQF